VKRIACSLAAFGGLNPFRALLATASTAIPGTPLPGTTSVSGSSSGSLAGKKGLIRRTYRPPNYEMPFEAFEHHFTPNDQFFVRYHLADIRMIDVREWELRVMGEGVAKPLVLTLEDLERNFPLVRLAAVCACAGNRRGLLKPRVPGIQWEYGAMGNARWAGVRLKDILEKAGLGENAVEVVFDGGDSGSLPKTPDFRKSLPMWKALDDNTLIAVEMNGHPLPHWNGFPARLVVPGWTATYWVKHVTDIKVVTTPDSGFWMSKAYRIPKDRFRNQDRFATQETDADAPITTIAVNSLITNLADKQRAPVREPLHIQGIAWDGGNGIQRVDISIDGGQNWRVAELGPDAGRFSWRPWSFAWRPERAGEAMVMVRATNRIGETQPFDAIANPSGYHHNAVQKLSINVG